MNTITLSKVPSLYQLITVDIFHRNHSIVEALPLKVGDFKLAGEVYKTGTTNSFLLGNYINTKNGKTAIGKFWSGQYKDYYYHTFKNEINIYKLLHKVLKRVKSLPKNIQGIHIPEVVKVVENKNSVLLLLEFREGKIANDFSTTTKLGIYWKSTNYISFLGTQMTPAELAYVPHRSAFDLIFLYPFLVIGAMLAHPNYIKTILGGVPIFVKGIPSLLESTDYGLIHRDLHFKNILVSKNQNTLLDLQYCAYSLKLYELVTTLRYRWGEDELYKKLLDQIYKKYKETPNFTNLFKSLSVLSATHGLIGRHFPEQKIGYWANFLNFANNYAN